MPLAAVLTALGLACAAAPAASSASSLLPLNGPVAPLLQALSEAPALPAAAGRPARPLAAALLAKLPFTGSPEEKAYFESLVDRLLESATARELAQVAAAQDAVVSVSFADFPTTEVYERAPGVKAFAGSHAAHAVRAEDSAAVVLNRSCLAIDPGVASVVCAGQLAHELFGHTLGWLEARGATRRAYWMYDDELLARVIQWNVVVELAGRLSDPEAYCAASSPDAFQRRLPGVYPSSLAALTRAELRAPEASLVAHLARAADDSQRGVLRGELDSVAGEAGRARREALSAAAADPVFDGLQRRLDALRQRLLAADGLLRLPDLCPDYL